MVSPAVLRGLCARVRLWLLVAPLAAAACASPLEALTGPSADELAAQAFASLDRAPATHLTGGFANAGRRFTLDCTVSRAGDAKGSVEIDGRPYQLLVSGGRTFVSGQGFGASYGDAKVARLYGDGWVMLDATGVSSLGGLATPCSVGRALREKRFQLKKKDGEARVGRQPAVELSDSSGKLFVSAGKQPRLLRIESARGYRAPDGSSDVRLDFSYPASIEIAPPGAFIDPANPRTFPAHYVAEGVRIGRCDASGCSLTASIRNLAGPPVGQSTATLKLRSADNSDLGGCTVNLPAIEFQQAQEVSCTVSGGAWSGFYANSADRQYFARATVQNPPYDT
jgi:hypothetical protein